MRRKIYRCALSWLFAVGAMPPVPLAVGGESAPADDPALVAHWAFDDGQGAVAKDVSGHGHDGAIGGAVVWSAQGRINGALTFNGKDTQVVVPNKPDLELTGDFTLAFWLHPTSLKKGERQGLLWKNFNNEFEVVLDGTGADTGKISYYQGDGKWEYMVGGPDTRPVMIPANVWTHIAITRSIKDKLLKFYLNGKKASAISFDKQPTTGNNDLIIGQGPGNAGCFSGLIDDARLYNKALVPEVIRTLHVDPPPPAGRPQIYLAEGEWRSQAVAGFADQPGDKWNKTSDLKVAIPKDKNAGWLERAVEIPAEWKDRRVMLHVDYLTPAARTFVNGAEAGELLAYGDEVDITTSVHFGGNNSLQFLFPRGGQGVKKMDVFSKTVFSCGKSVGDTEGGIDCKAASGFLDAGIRKSAMEGFYLESRPSDLSVDDVWYRTYTRGGARVSPRVEIRASKHYAGLKAKVILTDSATGRTASETELALPTLMPGINVQDFHVNAANLNLWELRGPNLYWGQVILYDSADKELDRSRPVRFGIREFWTQGKEFYLNNHPVHFVLDGPCRKFRTYAEMFQAGVTLTETDIATTVSFLFANPTALLNECDINGIACKADGVICSDAVSRIPVPDLRDPEALRSFTVWAQHHQKRLRNHPSLFFYLLTAYAESAVYSPITVGRTSSMNWNSPQISTAYLIQKELDPTRVYSVHSGPSFGEVATGNMYFNHLSWQSVEDWWSDWSKKGDLPISAVEFCGTAMNVDYLKGVGYTTEYDAIHSGDRAYADETDDYVRYNGDTWLKSCDLWDYSPYRYNVNVAAQSAEGHGRTYRAWRFRGIPCYAYVFNPEFGGGCGPGGSGHHPLLWQSHLNVLKPIQIWIGGPPERWTAKDRNYLAGDRIVKSVMMIRDMEGAEKWEIKWTVRLASQDKPIDEGRFEKSAGPYAREIWPFQFTAPAVREPAALALAITITTNDGRTEIGHDSFTMTVYPPSSKPTTGGRIGWAIVDPEGETTAWLKTLGVEPPSLGEVGEAVSTLIIGRRAMQPLRQLPFNLKDIENGMRVVIFEQHCADLAKIGFRMEDRCPRYVYVRQTDHPLSRGLTSDLLRDWRGDATLFSQGTERDYHKNSHFYHWSNRGSVASAIIETPHFGPFWSVLDTEFDLGYSPLLSWRHGKGEVIFCTLDLTGRVGNEPGATTAAENLVRYLDSPLAEEPQSKTAIALGETALQRLKSLLFAAEAWPNRLDPTRHIVVAAGTQAETLAAHRKEVAAFVKQGGDTLILAANAAFLADPLFDGKLSAKEVQTSRAARQVEAHPLLRGVGPQQLHWREVMRMTAIESTDPHYTSLLGGLMGVLTNGKGRFVFLQTDPEAIKDFTAMEAIGLALDKEAKRKETNVTAMARQHDRMRSSWQLNRLHSLVLANLDVRSSEELTGRIFKFKTEMPYAPVDRWVYLGPFPTPDLKKASPLEQDLSSWLNARDLNATDRNGRGETIGWYRPNDATYGQGVGGVIDFTKKYARQVGDVVVAVTQIWSTAEREATIQFGADWWLKIDVNGREVFRAEDKKGNFGHGFRHKLKVPLKAGWNDVACTVGSGSGGFALWFKISDPGDVRVEQSIVTPLSEPADLPTMGMTAEAVVEPSCNLYTQPIIENDDPYLFNAW